MFSILRCGRPEGLLLVRQNWGEDVRQHFSLLRFARVFQTPQFPLPPSRPAVVGVLN